MYTPLDQFKILSLISLKVFKLDFSITNMLIMLIVMLFFFINLIKFITNAFSSSLFIIPNNWQFLIETSYKITLKLLFDNLNKNGEIYFPFVSLIFLFILFCNLMGLIPYSFTCTSHLIVTFSISFSVFLGINIIGYKKYQLKLFSLFIPSNTSVFLALILVPIEFISYIAKPISLGVRLFINLMAGHTLLKVIVGFSWSMLVLEDIVTLIHFIPLLILIVLIVLELSVAMIQAYVFTILTCIYLNDSINLH